MFEFQGKAKLSSVNARAEAHGDKRVPAYDLKFEAACSNDALVYFHPELRQMLYKKDETPDLVDQANPEALTALRFPKLSPLKWDWEGTGYAVTIPFGIGGPSNIKLGDCKIDDFRFSPQNGGTVIVSFRVICHPETTDVGRICEYIQQDIDGLDVQPPEAKSVQELFGEEKASDAKRVLDPAAAWPFPNKSAA